MLLGLIFDLYKWHLFIAMTRDPKERSISRKAAEIIILKSKKKIFFVFIGFGSIFVITYLVLASFYIATAPTTPYDSSKKDPERELNALWIDAITSTISGFFIAFLIVYILTLSTLHHRLDKYFPVYYA